MRERVPGKPNPNVGMTGKRRSTRADRMGLATEYRPSASQKKDLRKRNFKELRNWSPEAVEYLHASLNDALAGRGRTWGTLLADLNARFSVKWNDSSLSRYWAYWQARVLEREDAARWMDLAERAVIAIEQIRDSLRGRRRRR